jgi:hypothetical protein
MLEREPDLTNSPVQPIPRWGPAGNSILRAHLGTTDYQQPPLPAAEGANALAYRTNEDVWRAIIGERVISGQEITLEGFDVLDWFPRAPGYLGGPPFPQSFSEISRSFESGGDQKEERRRKKIYNELRCNFPVCEVMPSLIAGQHNEARVWIEFHETEGDKKNERPLEVTWSAGDKHQVITVQRDTDPRFCATFHYHGPMLVQAKLSFPDGVAFGYVYVRMPTVYHRPDRGAIDL